MDYSCLNGMNTLFLEELYKKYLHDPNSVDYSWHPIFSQMVNQGVTAINDKKTNYIPDLLSIKVASLINEYRCNAHYIADVDPLHRIAAKAIEHDIDNIHQTVNLPEELHLHNKSINEIIDIMRSSYCRAIGMQFMHLSNIEERKWFQNKFESSDWKKQFNHEQKKKIFCDIMEAELFENYLHVKFPGAKRFSIEGGESAIAGLEAIIENSTNYGAQEVLIGMAHRGRLNVLTKVLKKKYSAMLYEFQGNIAHPSEYEAAGDVKYHLGYSCDRSLANGKKVHLSLAANPSHLEAVNPVLMGKVHCKQTILGDREEKTQALGVLIHGDAAFVGQGVVNECFNLHSVDHYNTGGIVHMIINNNIGFTTNQNEASGYHYPAYTAVSCDIPVFHTNGDDPEAIVFASMLAVEYRYRFKKDAIVGVHCYRRYGHNEGDEPRFTQPKMYSQIDQQPTLIKLYAEQLITEGVLTTDEVIKLQSDFKGYLDQELEEAKNYSPDPIKYYSNLWNNFKKPKIGSDFTIVPGIAKECLKDLAQKLSIIPQNITVHDKVKKLLSSRLDAVNNEINIDWGNAEHLALASLLQDGIDIRLSGQDCRRGTFSHRHAVIVDQVNETRHIPLNNLTDNQGNLEVIDTPLSEYAAMGFEYGYSLINPNNLVIWEAQFGDFMNGAQIIIDQFIASSETKWLQSSGLVLLLPHGYEGQGPEHSSARMERFLQLCADDNMQIVNCSTPANYFHILRRQVFNKFRKPLIVFTPKSLLRHKLAVSTLDDLSEQSNYQEIIPDIRDNSHDIKKIIFCSGKVYYDIAATVEKQNHIMVVRIEQLYPFPTKKIEQQLTQYPSAKIIWCQEEQKNMGAWCFIHQVFSEILDQKIKYIGRKASASTASGYLKVHNQEKQSFLDELI